MKIFVTALVAVALSACGPEDKEKAHAEKILSDAKQSVLRDLKDPESARFDQIRLVKNSVGENVACGRVNAKNSFGGYVGFLNFYSDGVSSQTISEETAQEAEAALRVAAFDSSTRPPLYPLIVLNFDLAGCAGPNIEARAREIIELRAQCGSSYPNCDAWIEKRAAFFERFGDKK